MTQQILHLPNVKRVFSALNKEKTKIELNQTHFPRVRNHLSSLQMMFSDIRFWCSTRTNKAKWNENIAKSFIKLIQFNREEWKRNELMNPHSNKWPMESMVRWNVRSTLFDSSRHENKSSEKEAERKKAIEKNVNSIEYTIQRLNFVYSMSATFFRSHFTSNSIPFCWFLVF